jgi:hypothetical protein
MANGCLAALFGFGSKPNSSNADGDERRKEYLAGESASTALPVVDLTEGDLHSGPGGYEANTAYPDTFYGGGSDGGYGGDGGAGSGGH